MVSKKVDISKLKESERKYGGRIAINVQPLYSDFIPAHHMISDFFMKNRMPEVALRKYFNELPGVFEVGIAWALPATPGSVLCIVVVFFPRVSHSSRSSGFS